MTPTGRSLVLDLLSTLRRGTMPVGALVEAGALFGIPGNTVRVALARLLASGQVARDERGRYRLGAGAAPVERRVRSWRELDRATRAWDGGWLGVHHGTSAAARRRTDGRGRERALRLLGFRSLEPTLAVRPDNLRADVHQVREELRALGLPSADVVMELRGLDASTDLRARRLWDAGRRRRLYQQRLGELLASEKRLEALSDEAAMVESFELGRSIIRDLVLDPLLPDAICPSHDRQALVAAVRRYDRRGRLAWAGFLKRFDVPTIGTPLDGGHDLSPHRLAG